MQEDFFSYPTYKVSHHADFFSFFLFFLQNIIMLGILK